MNPVSIQVTPGVKVNTLKYAIPENVDPLEDFSMIVCGVEHDGMYYEMPFFLKNSVLPLDEEQLASLRRLSNTKLQEALLKKSGDKQVKDNALSK